MRYDKHNMTTEKSIVIRPVRKTDLDSVNAVITSCVMDWDLPERVKRLSISSYYYHSHDLNHLNILLAETLGAEVVGIATWETAVASDLPKDKSGMLLHGLYVASQHQHHGIGSRLVNSALDAVRTQEMDGLLVKAQADAVGFFQSQGFINLPSENPESDYPHRWWRPVRSDDSIGN